ncbi:MAG: restriction endonuclease [Candidatus Dojkabacteria bacterium]|nr:restriction endonuclease [Candidatus Dojkabacteria bacterium]
MKEVFCPHCTKELVLDSNDLALEVIRCPSCGWFFLLSEAENGDSGDDLLLINIETKYNQDGSVKARAGYKANIGSRPLDRVVNISADSKYELSEKIRETAYDLKEQAKAEKSSLGIEEQMTMLQGILEHGIKTKIDFKWEDEKRRDKFEKKKPSFDKTKPKKEDVYRSLWIFENIFKKYAAKKNKEYEQRLKELTKDWEKEKKEFEKSLAEWEKEKESFEKEKEEFNKKIDEKIEKQKKGKKEIVEEYFEKILALSEYPTNFPHKFDLGYKAEEKMLVIEYVLPEYEVIPKYQREEYKRTTGERKKVPLSESAREKLYNEVLYSLPLRTLHEIFENDKYENIDSVVFNGWVDTLDKAKGKKKHICILTVHAKKEDFAEIDLRKVEPRACFNGLKGVGSSKLSSLAPVAPILKLNKEDKRFISAEEVLNDVDSSVNIASMDWEDFEHLVREVFEQEFAKSGMEVKVTQSSRDLGVDAVAFDPDPFRGGKIIIQAKRYTNTVKVESVRALYGIMQDEGAMKGIIVTTSDYGPDAYKFAQGKPITLINGNNLLSMLEKYGHKARIDIKEAKKLLQE